MRSIAIVPVFREVGRIGRVLERFKPGSVDEICLTLDSPNESIRAEIEESRKRTDVPVTIIENPDRKGVGHAIREGYNYALSHGFDLIIVIDYVQGSRFLPGGRPEKTPLLRGIFSRAFPLFWTLLTGVRCTEVTNGFRAYKASILTDPRVNVWQSWLDGYELEYYLHYKALTLRYRFTERPVTKTYSHIGKRGYSHISPLRDWWQIVGPMFLLRLGVRH